MRRDSNKWTVTNLALLGSRIRTNATTTSSSSVQEDTTGQSRIDFSFLVESYVKFTVSRENITAANFLPLKLVYR